MNRYLNQSLMQTQGLLKWISIIAASACAVLYGLAVYRYAVNAPFSDDFDAILGFLNTYQESSLQSFFNLISAQHNEHRIAFSKIIYAIYYTIFGKINFSHLIWIGNFGWIATIYLLWRYSKQCGIKVYQFAPVLIVLLTFSHYNLMTWAMASIALYYQILFALLTLYAMVNRNPLIAMLFLVCGTFTSGGGIALAPLVLLFYATQRQWPSFIMALITIIATLGIYFFALPYTSPAGHAHPLHNLSNPQLILKFFILFLGNFAKESLLLSSFFGMLIAILFLKFARSISKTTPYLWWVSLFIFVTDVMLSITRSGFGVEYATSSRYTQYSLLLISILYIYCLVQYTTEQSRLKITGVGLIFALILFKTWYPMGIERFMERTQTLLQNPLSTYYDPVNGQRILEKSQALGIFVFER